LAKNGIKNIRWNVNMHYKLAFAFTSFIMILFGLSISILSPKNNFTMGIGSSILIIFIYSVGIKLGQILGYKEILSPWFSVWSVNIIFILLGMYLFKISKT